MPVDGIWKARVFPIAAKSYKIMLNLTAKGGFQATRKQLRYAPAIILCDRAVPPALW